VISNPKIRKVADELVELETKAGIIDKVKDAALGPMFPNLDASSEEYFKEVEDHARRKVRKLYFSLDDVDVRKELIAKRRLFDSLCDADWQKDLATAQQNLTDKQRAAESLSWTRAGCIAVICVGAGSYFFKLYGAIGGGLMGFFLAQGTLASERNLKAAHVRTAQEELEEALKTERANQGTPDWFNYSEERTGERDEDFDRKSVYDSQIQPGL
jgi:hypothetical protein